MITEILQSLFESLFVLSDWTGRTRITVPSRSSKSKLVSGGGFT